MTGGLIIKAAITASITGTGLEIDQFICGGIG
jgi:hypothetical protein